MLHIVKQRYSFRIGVLYRPGKLAKRSLNIGVCFIPRRMQPLWRYMNIYQCKKCLHYGIEWFTVVRHKVKKDRSALDTLIPCDTTTIKLPLANVWYSRMHLVLQIRIILHGKVWSPSYSILTSDGVMLDIRNVYTGQPVGPHGLIYDGQSTQ